jgi:hypothetical protein
LLVQFFFRFQERKALKVLILAQQFAKLVQHVRVAQKIFAILGTILVKGFLNFFKHYPEPFFQNLGHFGRLHAVEYIRYVRDVLIVLVETQLFQECPNLGVGNLGEFFNLHLFEFGPELFDDLVWYRGGFLGLELGYPLVEMVFPFVRIVYNLFRRFLFLLVSEFVGESVRRHATVSTYVVTRRRIQEQIVRLAIWAHVDIDLGIPLYVLTFHGAQIIFKNFLFLKALFNFTVE